MNVGKLLIAVCLCAMFAQPATAVFRQFTGQRQHHRRSDCG